jgi:hypothetical protein
MGWNEADDEEYVITEDEKREFEKLSKQVNSHLHFAEYFRMIIL